MRNKVTYLFALCFTYLITGVSSNTLAQTRLGIVWEVPDNNNEVQQQLETFSRLGIEYLELQEPTDSQVLSLLKETNFTVLIRTDENYLTLSEIKKRRNELINEYQDMAARYQSFPNVAGLGLLSNSQTAHSDFSSTISPILSAAVQATNKSLYFFRRNAWFNFDEPDHAFGTRFDPDEFELHDLITLDKELRAVLSYNEQQVFFIPSAWFLTAIQTYPEFSESLLNFKNNDLWLLPLPDAEIPSFSPHWVVLILLVLWTILSMEVKYLPYVRPMMLRYFLAHRFFVEDILHYRERAVTGGIILMVMHAIFGGLVCYICSHLLISDIGLAAFFHHFPYLAIVGTNYISFFFIGLITLLFTQFIAIFWLYLPAKKLEHISQAINLYAGAFYFDFIILTIMITLFMAGTGTLLIYILAGLFGIIWYASFNITALDASKNFLIGRPTYLSLTIGLHTLVSVGLVMAFFSAPEIIQAFALALSV